MNPSGEHFLSVKKEKGMYVFDEIHTNNALHTAMPAKSHEKPTSIDQWHRRFCHFGKRTIKEMASKNLVDGLQIVVGKENLGMCEDCIYGKQTSRPYDERVVPEKDVLE
jgi:hypothetical protein